ncbi:MAG: peptidylprolyl isomerase [Candidatus Neomarinimicrobiota bacterium]
MALMTSMRERMHVVLWALLALFLLSMTVGGLVGGANIIDQLIGNTNPQTTIAKVNGEIISPSQFNSLVNQQLTNLKSNGQSVNDFQINQARNRAWDNMLQDILVTQEVERLGIKASNKEVMYHLENQPPTFLQQNPTFQTEGKFDLDKYLTALANPTGDEWVPIEQFMKNTYIPNFKLQKLIDEGIVISEDEVMAEFKNKNLDYTLTALHITSALVSKEDSEPTQDEILEKYNKIKSDEYKHSELRNLSYVSWKKEPSNQDSIDAKGLANELVKKASSGEEFASLANQYTMDPSNQGTKGGDLGWFKKGRMVRPFEEAAFQAKKNQIIGPVLSRFGYHIIHVRDKRIDNKGDSEILASHILIKIDISPSTLSSLRRSATLFSYDAQDNGFFSAAEDYNVNISKAEKLSADDLAVKGLGNLRSAVRFAFNNKINTVSDILENDQYFVLCSLDSIIPKGFKAIDEVEAQIMTKIKNEKAKMATLDETNKLLIDISSGAKDLSDLIKSEKGLDGFIKETKKLSQGFTSIGRSNYVTGAVSVAPIGKIIGPIETNQGYAILQVHSKSDFDSTAFAGQKDQIQKNLFSKKQNQYFQAWISNLKDKAEIIDNRNFYF